jgi:hypothetical protein
METEIKETGTDILVDTERIKGELVCGKRRSLK